MIFLSGAQIRCFGMLAGGGLSRLMACITRAVCAARLGW